VVLTDVIYNEDCLLGMQRIPDGSVDMILSDLPYGALECRWDLMLPLEEMWQAYRRLLRATGSIVLTATQPFTARLVLSNQEMFKYSLVWRKSIAGCFAQAKYRFLNEHEDVLIFSKGGLAKNAKLHATFHPQGLKSSHIVFKEKKDTRAMRPGRKPDKAYIQTQAGYPKSILEFRSETGLHPTQKPVALFEYLIRTYTNPGELVLDSCIGSGTTAIACIRSGRHYIGFEKDPHYFETCQKRIHAPQQYSIEELAQCSASRVGIAADCAVSGAIDAGAMGARERLGYVCAGE
jgi:site-specific DNA-methyltransferase (adenine-specific)